MKNKITWGGLIVLLYVVFCYLIPVNIYSLSPRLIAIAGAVATTVCLFFFISYFPGLDQKVLPNEPETPGAGGETPNAEQAAPGTEQQVTVRIAKRQVIDTGFTKFILALVSISFFTFLYNIKEHEIERRETDLHGELAEAKITEVSTFQWRRPNVSDLTITFKTKDGTPSTATIRMSDQKANAYRIHQEVFVLYSSRYPHVFRILTTGEDLKTDRTKKRD